jgi:hypothetical protein
MSKHNLDLLVEAARLLKPLLGELVFVGGSTTALLITDKAAADVRPTYDVDAIAEISSYAAYADFSERLRKCGFTEDASEGAPICRWRQKKTILDVMPLDEKILGFSNRWYKPALDSAVEHELGPDLRVRIVTGVYFCATKLEAFAGRGQVGFRLSFSPKGSVNVAGLKGLLRHSVLGCRESWSGETVLLYPADEFAALFSEGPMGSPVSTAPPGECHAITNR